MDILPVVVELLRCKIRVTLDEGYADHYCVACLIFGRHIVFYASEYKIYKILMFGKCTERCGVQQDDSSVRSLSVLRRDPLPAGKGQPNTQLFTEYKPRFCFGYYIIV